MNMKKTALGIIRLTALMLPALNAGAAVINLTNPGFETGGLSGWNSIGNVSATPTTSVTTYNGITYAINANGTNMAHLVSDTGGSILSIEYFLGIASGTLQPYNSNPDDGDLTSGAAISQDFSGNVNDTLSMYWNYVATDYTPFNDPAFAVVVAPDGSTFVDPLASTHGLGAAVGTAGNSGWNLFQYTLTQTGNYKIAFVTMNDKDTVLDSHLFLDSEAGTCTPNCPVPTNPVPEPATILLFGSGLIGIVESRRRRSIANAK